MKLVAGLAVGFVMALVGCATAPDEEPETSLATESEIRSNARAERPGECQFGAGLYCGNHGVEGAVNVLYRCGGGEVRAAELCVGPCEKMPDGVNDRCTQTAAVADAPPQAETPPQQQPQQQTKPPPPPPRAPLCGYGLTCSGSSTSGASACRQTTSSSTSIFCCPIPGSTISNGRCIAPAPICGTSLYCAANAIGGSSACRQTASSTTRVYCCPYGERIVNGVCQ